METEDKPKNGRVTKKGTEGELYKCNSFDLNLRNR